MRFLTFDDAVSLRNITRNRQTISRLPVDVIVDVAPASRADYYEAIANVSAPDVTATFVLS
jgi:hypothetical protein